MTTCSASKAASFWTQRVKSTDELAAVLSYSLPEQIHQAYQ